MQANTPRYRYLLVVPLFLVAIGGLGAAPAVVRSLTAGFGLVGGGTGNVTLAVDTAAIQRRVTGACGAGEAISAVSSTGAVSCTPAGTPLLAFVHDVTAETIPEVEPEVSIIDKPATNGDPDAVLVVTPRVNDPGGANVVDPHPIAVSYVTTATCPNCDPVLLNRWMLSHADSAVMTAGVSFNVLVVKP